MVITALIFSLAVFSINLLTGFTGLLSFGQAGFVGIGAYTLGVMAKQGTPPLLAGLYGVLLAMLCGFLLGLPAARLKGHYLAIGTLGFGILVFQLLTNSVDITRGSPKRGNGGSSGWQQSRTPSLSATGTTSLRKSTKCLRS